MQADANVHYKLYVVLVHKSTYSTGHRYYDLTVCTTMLFAYCTRIYSRGIEMSSIVEIFIAIINDDKKSIQIIKMKRTFYK